MTKGLAVLFAILAAGTAFAASWSGSFHFSANSVDLTTVQQEDGNYQLVTPAGPRGGDLATTMAGKPGQPALPTWHFTICVPQGMKVAGVDVSSSGASGLQLAYPVMPVQQPVPFTETALPPFVKADRAIYGSDAVFPATLAEVTPVGIKSGYRLATVMLHPVQYSPASGRLTVAGRLSVNVRFEPDPAARPEFLTSAQAQTFGSAVKALVINPQDVDRYAPHVRATDFGTIDCVIITSSALEASFQPLVDWRTRKGFKTETRLVSWITSNYSGRDNQEKIRNFIIDYYNNQGIRWVLLGGDDGVVPCRQARAYVSSYTGDIPTDLYYVDIQGTWDDDNDNIFGEDGDDDVDLYHDLYVGRASVDNTTQVQTFVDKILTHEKNPPTDYLRKMLMADALLWSGYNHRQSNDSIAAITPSGWTDVIIHDPGSSTVVRDSINNGFQFCHFIGHGNEYGIYDGSNAFYNTNFANGQTNGDRVNFMNANSCYTGNFEYSDCVAEAAHNRDGGGSIGVVFNSRYGWGTPPSMGPSEVLDIRFYDYFFNHDTMPIGITEALSKEVYRGWALGDQCWRWCYYETNLLGDPLLMMYESVPAQLAAAFTDPIGAGSQSFLVTVTSGGSNVQNALVCVMKGTEVYDRNYTNSSGQVTFSITPASSGYMWVTATKANYLPAEDSSQVIGGLALDASSARIIAPTGTLDSGAVVTPQTVVKNYGSQTVSFPVSLRIGSGYTNTQNVTNLASGDSATVSFTNWTASQRGALTVRCSTGLSGDQVPANDTLGGSVTVRVTNAGVTVIVGPTGTVDSGTSNTVRARVKNFGTATVSFPVTFRIGAGYSDVQNVTNLAAGDSVTLTFANWIASQRGVFATKCTCALAGDQVAGNNYQSGNVTVRVLDVAMMSIIAPTGTLDSGAVVTPRAKVLNRGSAQASFPVTFSIGSFYSNTQNVTNLSPGDSATVSFTNWTASQRGSHATRCSTNLTGDQMRGNDTMSGSVAVRVMNVGTTVILAPSGLYDSGTVVQPQARVKNFGTAAASFPVTFRIGAGYSDVQNVTTLAAGDSILLTFADWTASPLGTFATLCTTSLAGDQAASDDYRTGSVDVYWPGDAGVIGIVAPSGMVDSGAVVAPSAWVRNFGTAAASFPVVFRVGTLYGDIQTVTGLLPGDSSLVSFAPWTAVQRGTWAVGCTTALPGDTIASNDGATGSVLVRVMDVCAWSMQSPSGTYEPGRAVVPVATWRNSGSAPAAFWAYAFLHDGAGARVYSESAWVASLDPGEPFQVTSFSACTLRTLGTWQLRCSTALAGDVNPGNDVLYRGFNVAAFWREVKSMPRTPTNTDVKEGAWVTWMSSDGNVYAAKGHATVDFYSFSPATGNWTVLKSVPYGSDGKTLRKGACATTDGNRYVYTAKGNNTLGFYRYDITDSTWLQLADVLPGDRKVKAGAGMTYIQTGDTGYVYLLKGYGTDFLRFNTVSNAWQSCAAAPMGGKPKWDNGSWVVSDGGSLIYAHKAKVHELWTYDVAAGAWGDKALSPIPYVSRTGRSKKSKDGGSAAWFGGTIYALKGGNTNEFWTYNAALNSWTESDTVPTYGSSGKRKRISAGGSITSAAGTLYALKGNKTNEMWCYVAGAVAAIPGREPAEGVMAAPTTIGNLGLAIGPNPAVGSGAVLRYSMGGASAGRITVRDAAGRTVLARTVAGRTGSLQLQLPAGVYVVQLSNNGYAETQKLVIQR